MAAEFLSLSMVLIVAVGAAPPAPSHLYPQPAPEHLQHLQQYDYYLNSQEAANYYNQPQQKQAATNIQGPAPARLESLEPDSEVELIPGAQQPQQPPQTPVSPNIPGLLPGQRVFIVHMPVPGYRPGSIGGYQPVYIVAAAPQGNTAYTPNAVNGYQGYQNTVFLDQSGQPVYSPLLGYPRGVQQGVHPGYFLAPQFQPLKGPYQDPNVAYQGPNVAFQPQQVVGARPVHLSQLIALQTHPGGPANSPRATANANSEPKRLVQSREPVEVKETEQRARPAQAQELKA